MTILNQANDGLFSVLIVLVRALVRFGPRKREELVLACGGAVEGFDTSKLNQTLNRWTELGLFGLDNETVIIAEPYCAALGKNADTAEANLPKIVRTIVLLPTNNERFWESEGNRSADLSRGMAWMLAQEIYRLDTSVRHLTELESQQLIDSNTRRIVQNNTRWAALRAWMLYLGFAQDGMQWVVDPTQALRESLADIFRSHRELSGPAFIENAARVLPVLDGGTYRVNVEAALKESALPWLRPGLVSMSLSRAIQRLEREGSIRLSNRSDSEGAISLTGSNTRTWRDVSHISLIQAGKAH